MTVKRDERGRILPGSSGLGGGRPALPSWLRDHAPQALRWLADIATGVEAVDDNLRMKAVERLCDLVYGAPGKARLDVGTYSPAEQITRLEARAVQSADEGDLATVTACAKVLAVLAPERWGDKVPAAGDDVAIDLPTWVPLIQA